MDHLTAEGGSMAEGLNCGLNALQPLNTISRLVSRPFT